MAGLGYDLIVDDDGIKKEADMVFNRMNEFEMQLKILGRVLEEVTDNAIMEGNTADNLKVFAEQVQNLQEEAKDITKQLKTTIYRYIESMDEADSCVY